MAKIVLDPDKFREMFPHYADKTDEEIEAMWDLVTCYISDEYGCGRLSGKCREKAMYLMLAHLFYIEENWSGETPALNGTVTQTTIGVVSVSIQAPPAGSQYQWWLNTSPFGKTLAAMLSALAAPGMMVSRGYPEQRALKKAGGMW